MLRDDSSSFRLDYTRIRLCEREEELKQLRSSQSCAMRGRATTVFIEGLSGTGKSLLVSKFLENNESCYICRGKFDETETASPFSAIVDAFDELFCDSALEPQLWKEIQEKCDYAALQTLLPSLSEGFNTMKHQQTASDFDRLRVAIRDLVRKVASNNPLILVLDDLHWADIGSLRLIETLVKDSQTSRPFLFIGLHRPVEEQHILAPLLSIVNATRLQVSNLSVHGVSQVFASLFRRDTEEVQPLAAVVHSKTQGNPLFVGHFLRMLEHRELLWFSFSSYQWKWDVGKIQSHTDISDNPDVLEVLAGKIRSMDVLYQQALIRASCLGVSQLSAGMLGCIMDPIGEDGGEADKSARSKGEAEEDWVNRALNYLVDEGLLECLSSSMYKFSHDKIREGAYSLLVDVQERTELHLLIGRRLNAQRSLKSNDSPDLLLHTVRQMNAAADLVVDASERDDLAKLNYEAAEQAMARLSFYPACDFLRMGIRLLGKDPWKSNYELTSKLTTSLSRMEFCVGRLDQGLQLADEVLERASSFSAKQTAYKVKIRSLIQLGRGEEAFQVSCAVLNELKVPVPPANLVNQELAREEKRVWLLLKNKTDDELRNLPRLERDAMSDIRAAFTEGLGEVVIHTLMAPVAYLHLVLVRLMRTTLAEGRLPRTASSFVFWGWYLVAHGKYDEGLRFGKIGLHYAAQRQGGVNDDRAISLFYFYVFHWRWPYQNGVAPSFGSIKGMWDAGAIELVHLNTVCYFRLYFCAGLSLDALVKDICKFSDLLSEYPRSSSFRGNESFFQMVWNITGRSDHTTLLTGEFMDQKECESKWLATNNQKSLQKLYFLRLLAATYFGDFSLAVELGEKLLGTDFEGPTVWVPYRYFALGLAYTVLARATKKRKLRKRSNLIIRHVEKWVGGGLVNAHHMLLLLRAERLGGTTANSDIVRKAYDAAIGMAGRSGFLNNQALANEQAGNYFLSHNDVLWASTYLGRALDLYREWGATGKVRQLFAKHSLLLDLTEASGSGSFNYAARSRLEELVVESPFG